MPGCAAIGCSNRSEKGFLMKSFPRDPVRRKEWVARTKRDKWTPTNNSFLCEIHFEPNMWEKTREDGTRRLKHNAVPTIFGFTKKNLEEILVVPDILLSDDNINKTSPGITSSPPVVIEIDNTANTSTTNNSTTNNSLFSSIKSEESLDLNKLQEKLFFYERNYKEMVVRNRILKNKLKTMQRKMRNLNIKLQEKHKVINNDNYLRLLRSVFTRDQIIAMKGSRKFKQWSNQTIEKALKLKIACGNSGYHELLKQKIPLPSPRTLSRRLQDLKFESSILLRLRL